MVKSGYNSEAVRFLRKAELYAPDDFRIRYKLAIILSDLDPEKNLQENTELIVSPPRPV